MGSILTNGVGSGLDVSGIVTKLVEAEGKPQSTRLDTQEAKAQAKLSALGSLRSALVELSRCAQGPQDSRQLPRT